MTNKGTKGTRLCTVLFKLFSATVIVYRNLKTSKTDRAVELTIRLSSPDIIKSNIVNRTKLSYRRHCLLHRSCYF